MILCGHFSPKSNSINAEFDFILVLLLITIKTHIKKKLIYSKQMNLFKRFKRHQAWCLLMALIKSFNLVIFMLSNIINVYRGYFRN